MKAIIAEVAIKESCASAYSLWLICVVGSGVSHFPLDNNPQILKRGSKVRWVEWPIQHSDNRVSKPVTSGFDSVGRCKVPLEKKIKSFPKACQQREAWNAQKCPALTGVHHHQQNHHWLWKLRTGLQATLILWPLTLSPHSWNLHSKWNKKVTFIWKMNFFYFSLSQAINQSGTAVGPLNTFCMPSWI